MTLLAQPHVLRNVVGHQTANNQGFVGRLLIADLEGTSVLRAPRPDEGTAACARRARPAMGQHR